MMLETERLILRQWRESDAEDLFELAKDPKIGPAAGWQPHTSVENSREIIRTVLNGELNYAVILKSENRLAGCIGLMLGEDSNLKIAGNEGEIGYWIGVPYWGQGLIPEAVRELLRYGFEDLNLKTMWCAYFDGNLKSKRVQEKCGFKYHHTNENIYWELLNEIKTEHVTRLKKEEWLEGII